MNEQEAKKRAREWSRKSGHVVFVQHFHGGYSISETIDHEGGWLKYSKGRLVDTNLTGDLWVSA